MRTILCLFLLLSVAVISCNKNEKQQTAPPPAAVNVIEARQQPVTGVDLYPATVVPINEVELRPQLAGYITKIYHYCPTKVNQKSHRFIVKKQLKTGF